MGGAAGWGSARSAGMTMMKNVDERIRFLLRTAIRIESSGDTQVARLFRRMAEDMRTGEGALLSNGPVLGVVAD